MSPKSLESDAYFKLKGGIAPQGSGALAKTPHDRSQTGQAADTQSSLAGTPAKIMVMGDSISEGLEGDFTWRYRLKQKLAANIDLVGPYTGISGTGMQVHTASYRPGITFADSQHFATWGWQMFKAKDTVKSYVLSYDPDVLLIELGFNDLGWGVTGAEGTIASFESVVDQARIAKPGIKILIANVPQRSFLEFHPDLNQKIVAYNKLLSARVPQLSSSISPIRLVDFDGPYDFATDAYDGLHPNIRGEYVIAKAFADALAHFGVGGGFGAVPAISDSPIVPRAPINMSASNSRYDAQLNWSHSFGASGYELWSRDATAGTDFTRAQFNVGGESWIAGYLPAGHTLQFYVRSVRGDTIGGASPTASATMPGLATVPSVTASADPVKPYTITLKWGAVAGADDYAVYSIDSCSSLGEAPWDKYKLQQYGLGSKLTWTQSFVTEPCKTYKVLATRYGGLGAHSTAGTKASPYRNNRYYADSQCLNLGGCALPKGWSQASMNVPAKANVNQGIVILRSYISGTIKNGPVNDGRSWTGNPWASSRVAIGWEPSTGKVVIRAQDTCIQEAWQWTCFDAQPISITGNTQGCRDNTSATCFYAQPRPDGSLNIQVAATNGAHEVGGGVLGSIDQSWVLTPSGRTLNTSALIDKFPSVEALRIPWNDNTILSETGVFTTLGTRGESTITDLNEPGIFCTSVGEVRNSIPRNMSC